MKKILLLFTFICIFFTYSNGQTRQSSLLNELSSFMPRTLQTFPSPNAEAFQVFGQVPVSLFTGTPNISIPIYEIEEGEIKVPISLAYHCYNRKVNSMPSWVGLGWSLNIGGIITRNIRGSKDESTKELEISYYDINNVVGKKGYLYNHTYWYNYNKNIVANGFEGNVLIQSYHSFDCTLNKADIQIADHLPDEFSFNFMGYSGAFFYDGASKSFKVISNDQIKITFDTISLDTSVISGKNVYNNRKETHFIKFQLTVPDGTVYEFGGMDATEFAVDMFAVHPEHEISSAWHLTKIKSPDGSQVELKYERDHIIRHLYAFYKFTEYSFYHVDTNLRCDKAKNCPNTTPIRRLIQGQIISPVYLKEIESSSNKIVFNRSVSKSLSYDSIDSKKGLFEYDFESGRRGDNLRLEGIWYKLDSIKIYGLDNLLKTIQFSYIENLSERLKLSYIQENTENERKPRYIFEYNPNKLPNFATDSIDHWGYANDIKLQMPSDDFFSCLTFIDDFYLQKEPTLNSNIYLAETLEKIIYPTGGFSLFEYEPHDYNIKVSVNRDSLIYSPKQLAGGLRIKSIYNFESENAQSNSVKTYIYRKLVNGVIDNESNSSGILAGTPTYSYSLRGKKHIKGLPHIIFNSGMIMPYGEVAFGSHMGYSAVIEEERELNSNGEAGNLVGYRYCTFTNFDEDINGIAHMDGELSTPISNSLYNGKVFISDSKHEERGKLTSEDLYSSLNKLVQKTEIKYQHILINQNTKRTFHTFDFFPNCSVNLLYVELESLLTLPNTLYRPQSKKITTYATSGEDSLVTETSYTYNERRLIASETVKNSEGDNIQTQFFYPDDYNCNYQHNIQPYGAIKLMKSDNKHMINRPIEIRQLVNGNIRAATIQLYDVFPTDYLMPLSGSIGYESYVIKPKADYILGANQPMTQYLPLLVFIDFSGDAMIPPAYQTTTTYDFYDPAGNIRSFRHQDQVPICVIWGYKKTKPIAYIQNAEWADIVSVLGMSAINDLEQSTSSLFITLTLNTLRNHASMKKAQMHTYTYELPFGIKSATDPAGVTTYYEYDGFGRLTSVKDNNLSILEKIYYNYKSN